MKNLITIFLIVIFAIGFCSCDKKAEPQKWEYFTLKIDANRPAYSGLEELAKFSSNDFEIPQTEMDSLGSQGWELVNVYTILETVHPNFGDQKYVTGLQPNTRTAAVCYVFKRPKTENPEKDENVTDSVVVEEVAVETVADTCTAVAE